jgi:hypothetical protein
MVFDGRWKYIHAEGFRPLLFDLMTDLDELVDLGGEPVNEEVQARQNEALFAWAHHHSRIPRTPQQVNHMAQMAEPPGNLIRYWDENEIREAGKNTIYPKVY